MAKKNDVFDANHLLEPTPRHEILDITSTIFRILTYQHMALISLKNGDTKELEHEVAESSRELDLLFESLNDLTGRAG